MSKRPGGSISKPGIKVKKRKGIKVRSINVPESDDESPLPDANIDYARLLKTRIATSGKAGSVTMDALPVFEVEDATHADSLELPVSGNEIAVENTVLVAKSKKRRKKANDSVRKRLFISFFATNNL